MAPRALEFSLEDAEKLMKLRANGQLMKDAFVIFNRARKEAGKQDFSVGTFQRIWKSIRETQKTFGTAEAHWKTIMEALCAQDNCVSCKNISEEIRAALSNASQQLFAMQQKNGKFMYDRKDFEDSLPSNLSFANTNAIDDSGIESESHSHHAYVCDGLNQKSSNRLSNNGDTLDQSDIMIGQTIGSPTMLYPEVVVETGFVFVCFRMWSIKLFQSHASFQ